MSSSFAKQQIEQKRVEQLKLKSLLGKPPTHLFPIKKIFQDLGVQVSSISLPHKKQTFLDTFWFVHIVQFYRACRLKISILFPYDALFYLPSLGRDLCAVFLREATI